MTSSPFGLSRVIPVGRGVVDGLIVAANLYLSAVLAGCQLLCLLNPITNALNCSPVIQPLQQFGWFLCSQFCKRMDPRFVQCAGECWANPFDLCQIIGTLRWLDCYRRVYLLTLSHWQRRLRWLFGFRRTTRLSCDR